MRLAVLRGHAGRKSHAETEPDWEANKVHATREFTCAFL
jgi:hypothetical protein